MSAQSEEHCVLRFPLIWICSKGAMECFLWNNLTFISWRMASLKREYISCIGTSATQTVLERAEGKQSSLSTTTLKCKRATSLVGLRPLWNLRSKNRRLPRTTSSCCCPTPPHWTPPALPGLHQRSIGAPTGCVRLPWCTSVLCVWERWA